MKRRSWQRETIQCVVAFLVLELIILVVLQGHLEIHWKRNTHNQGAPKALTNSDSQRAQKADVQALASDGSEVLPSGVPLPKGNLDPSIVRPQDLPKTRKHGGGIAAKVRKAFLLANATKELAISHNETDLAEKIRGKAQQACTPDSTCRKVVIPARCKNGLGHRFMSMLVAQEFACRHKAEFKLVADIWNHEGEHGNYSWFNQFFRMDDLTMGGNDAKGLRVVEVKDEEQLPDSLQGCNLLIKVYTARRTFCGGQWCSERDPRERVSYYERFRNWWAVRHKLPRFRVELFERRKKNERGILAVAWHIRNGDWLSNIEGTFYPNLVEEMSKLEKHAKAHHFRFRHEVHGETAYLPDVFTHTHGDFVPSLWIERPAQKTLQAMSSADILVGSGSSFVMIAVICAPEGSLFFYPGGKVDRNFHENYQFYYMSDAIQVEKNGRLEGTKKARIHRVIGSLSSAHQHHKCAILDAISFSVTSTYY